VSSSKRSVNPDPSPDPPEPSGVVVGAIVVVVVLFFGTKYAGKKMTEKTVAKLKKPSKNLTDRLMFTKCTELSSIGRFYIDIIHLAPTHCK